MRAIAVWDISGLMGCLVMAPHMLAVLGSRAKAERSYGFIAACRIIFGSLGAGAQPPQTPVAGLIFDVVQIELSLDASIRGPHGPNANNPGL